MPIKPRILILVVALSLTCAGAGAGAARGDLPPTRAQYIATVDPICASGAQAAIQSLSPFTRPGQYHDDAKHPRRLLKQILGLQLHNAETEAAVTQRVAAVPQPPEDAPLLTIWLNSRRLDDTIQLQAARALHAGRFNKSLALLFGNAEHVIVTHQLVTGYGFQFCG